MAFARYFAFLLIPITAGVLSAQTGLGSIQGTITDQSGAVIPEASVVAVHVETGNSFNTTSNQTGFFIFPSMQIGRYRLTVEAPGMENWQGELLLQSGQEAVVAPSLKIGATATQVTVEDVTPLITTTNPTIATVVDRARIEQLPLNGRNFINLLVTTTPGLEDGAYGAANAQAYGLRDTTMQFTQDGVPIKDANTGALTTRPPGMDTTEEWRVEMNVPSAKYSAPVTTIMSTRSGTNRWHGSAFYTGRNNGFGVARARQDYYDKPPQYIRNEYGASLGGPVRIPRVYDGKDRTFFFAAWESYALRSGSTLSTSLPTQAMREGDFSGLTDGQSRPIILYDPWSTGNKASNYARTPYPDNVISLTDRSPLAEYFFSVLPLPTQSNINPSIGPNYFGPSPNKGDDWTFTTRIDHRIGDRDQIFGRYTIGNQANILRRPNNQTPITSDNYWNYQTNSTRMHTFSLNWNHTFSPSFFVETIGTGAIIDWRFDLGAGNMTDDVASELGVPNPLSHGGAPKLTNLGFNLEGQSAIPRYDYTKPISAAQNYMKVMGHHQLQFGWRFERMFLDVLPDQPAQSAISFASQATGVYDPKTGTAFNSLPRTGDNLANFYLGIAASYSQTAAAPLANLRSNEVAGYIQDNWRITPRLTLNLGLRYTFLQPLLAPSTNAVFDFDNHAIVRNSTIGELIQSGVTTQAIVDRFTAIGVNFETAQEAGLSSNLVNVGQRNFDPRIGFAYNWTLGGHPMVLRGGFGEYRFNLGTRLFNVQRATPPLQGTVAYNINSAGQAPDGFANYALRSAPTVIAGTSSAIDAINPNAANAVGRGVAINAFATELPTSMAREWNLTLETEIWRKILFRVAYVGTQGRNLDQTIYENGQPNNYVWYMETGLPLPTGPFASVARRNYDQTTYGNIALYSHTGYSNFNGLQIEAQRRFENGLGFQWSYVMSNALWVGSGKQIQTGSSQLPDPVTFFPGTVPSDFDEYNRFYNYSRDYYIPKHRVKWNVLYDLPVGTGKKFLSGSGRLLNGIVGGWELAASSSMGSRYITLPTNNWGRIGDIEIYGTKYPIEDCRSGTCIGGYLWWNGYIPANQINTYDSAGQCTGVCGVPADYQPSNQPVWPFPATVSSNDPNKSLYGTNYVYIPLQNGKQQRVAVNTGLHPWRNQYIPGPWSWVVNSSLFKVIPLKERLTLRLNVDAFNVFNSPGMTLPADTGIISLQQSLHTPRQLQWTARLTW